MWVKRRGTGVVGVDSVVGFAGAVVGIAAATVSVVVGAAVGTAVVFCFLLLVGAATVGAAVIVGAAVGTVVGCFCLLLVGAAAVGAADDGAGTIGVGAVAGGPLVCRCFSLLFLFVARLNLSDEKVTLSPPIGSGGVGAGACDEASGTL